MLAARTNDNHQLGSLHAPYISDAGISKAKQITQFAYS